MTLREAMTQQVANPKKRIIREPNYRGYIDVWFTVKNDVLMVNGYTLDLAHGHRPSQAVASFQESPHTDWILID